MRLLITVVLICCSCNGRSPALKKEVRDAPVITRTPHELAQLISSIRPWSASGAYSDSDWERLVQVAVTFQQALPAVATEGFKIFSLQNTNNFHNDYLEDSKAFLLLRMMFDLPEHATARSGGPGWLTSRGEVNSDGTVNLAWPVVWNNGQPSLASGYLGYEGFSYDPKSDYLFFNSRFAKRALGSFKGKPEKVLLTP
jgi:hypothetical protein